MIRLLVLKVVLVVLFVSLCDVICVDDVKDETVEGENADAGMWFGPRLGKRARLEADSDRDTILKMLEAADAMKYYYDQIQMYPRNDDPENKVSKKVVFTPKLGRAAEAEKTFEVDFTPRLGRSGPPSDREVIRNGPKVESRSQYFSPRLGRGGAGLFSPRLGRNIVYDLYPLSRVRVARSANVTVT